MATIVASPAAFVITGTAATFTVSTTQTGRVRDGDGGGSERAYRRRRTGYRVHKWQIEDTPLEEAAEEIVAEVADVPAERAVEFIEANADILTLLGVPTAPMIDRLEAASTVALPRVADVEMARIRAIIEDYLDEEETIAMLLAS